MAFDMYVSLNVKVGDIILKEGEASDCLYILKKGELEIFKNVQGTDQFRPVGVVYPGEMFGEMSFLDNLPRSATVKAKTDCMIYMINRVEFDKILATQDPMVISLVKTLSDRLRKAIDQIAF